MIIMKIGVKACLTQIELIANGALVTFAHNWRTSTRLAHDTIVQVEFFLLEEAIIFELLFEQLKRAKCFTTQRTLELRFAVRFLMIGPHFHTLNMHIISTTKSLTTSTEKIKSIINSVCCWSC